MKNFPKYLMVMIIVSFFSGCVINPATGEKEMSSTAIGATAGALTGIVLSNLTGQKHNREGYAAIGAALGGGVGYSMDREEAYLRQELLQHGVQVQKLSDGRVRLVMNSDITFDTGDYNIKPSNVSTLNAVAKALKEVNDTYIQVAGHTDPRGDANYNQTLSEKRAIAIAQYLSGQGLREGRFNQVIGYGERHPAANCNDYSCQRSVEITISK